MLEPLWPLQHPASWTRALTGTASQDLHACKYTPSHYAACMLLTDLWWYVCIVLMCVWLCIFCVGAAIVALHMNMHMSISLCR